MRWARGGVSNEREEKKKSLGTQQITESKGG